MGSSDTTLGPLPTLLYDAVSHILDRIQSDPDVHYYCGFGTETFARLCRAEAAVTGEPEAVVRERRSKDMQPGYRSRGPEVVELRERVRELERSGDPAEVHDRVDERVREATDDLEQQVAKLARRPCPHCNRCPECGFDRHPCVCP